MRFFVSSSFLHSSFSRLLRSAVGKARLRKLEQSLDNGSISNVDFWYLHISSRPMDVFAVGCDPCAKIRGCHMFAGGFGLLNLRSVD